jgi:Glycosyltransferase like family
MFSIIICSNDPTRFSTARAMYEGIFRGIDWELIRIDDARSLAEGYTQGISRSRGDLIILSHDDITIFSPDMPRRLQAHLSACDLVGVAGTTKLIHPAWIFAGPPFVFGQIVHPAPDGGMGVDIYGAPSPLVRNIQALDGMFIAGRREIFERIGFDARTFDGFHLYDIDFSYRAFLAGMRLAVANDICMRHASTGKFDETWLRYANRFGAKFFPGQHDPHIERSKWPFVKIATLAEALHVMSPSHWRQQYESTSDNH